MHRLLPKLHDNRPDIVPRVFTKESGVNCSDSWVSESAKVSTKCQIKRSIIGDNCELGQAAKVDNSVIMAGTQVQAGYAKDFIDNFSLKSSTLKCHNQELHCVQRREHWREGGFGHVHRGTRAESSAKGYANIYYKITKIGVIWIFYSEAIECHSGRGEGNGSRRLNRNVQICASHIGFFFVATIDCSLSCKIFLFVCVINDK